MIIDVYGDGSVVVEGEVGQFVAVTIPQPLRFSRPGDPNILPWINSLIKVGLIFHSDGHDCAIFRIEELK